MPGKARMGMGFFSESARENETAGVCCPESFLKGGQRRQDSERASETAVEVLPVLCGSPGGRHGTDTALAGHGIPEAGTYKRGTQGERDPGYL